jgi:hypothetical protein
MTMTHRLFLAALLAGLALAAAGTIAADNKDNEKQTDKGWVQLFNGKDLTGWKLHPNPNPAIEAIDAGLKDGRVIAYEGQLKNGKVVPLWRVEDGILVGSGPYSHLFSERGDYENFRYRVVAMINDHGNSGQYFRTKFGPGFPDGYEAQINATHGDPIRTGSLYPDPRRKFTPDEVKKLKILEAPHKPNEWFTQEVIADGNHIIIKVNGQTTVDFVDTHNNARKGHFALQGHDPGTVVKFKKVEVMELPASK